MPHVVALYRYPVKGFKPEACESLTLTADGRVAGDRVLSFRFADAGIPEEAWSRKYGHVVLANTPGLARLRAHFDPQAKRLRIMLGGEVLVEDTLDAGGRLRLAAAVERHVAALPENPLAGHPERTPLKLIGDGVTTRYTDSERGEITLHSRASVTDAGRALGDAALDEVRFRSNIAIEGARAWEEQDWVGKRLMLGEVELEVVRPKTRCLATHANPRSGERDLDVMGTLVRAFAQRQPTFAVALTTLGRGGIVRLGDEVRLN
jgi:uncharacterized protein